MIPLQPSSTRTDTLLPYTELFRSVWPGAAHPVVQRVLAPLACRDLGHDLLRQHVQRCLRHHQRIELAAAHAVQQRGAFHQVLARVREQPALGRSEEHTSELQSLMRISYAVFCLKKNKTYTLP